jgi:hypothetical protein
MNLGHKKAQDYLVLFVFCAFWRLIMDYADFAPTRTGTIIGTSF